MHVVTAQEMRELDRLAIEQLGIPALVLMENAGREAAHEIQPVFQSDQRPILMLVGKGNNGGDGLVAARHLMEAGRKVAILYAEPPERLRGEAAIQRDIVEKLEIPAMVFQPNDGLDAGMAQIDWRQYAGIVDALLGTGTKGAPREPYRSLIQQANESGLPIVAIDIPSGLDADTGKLHESHIRATATVALAFLKRGLVLYPGATAAGRVVTVSIGIPRSFADQMGNRIFWLDESCLEERFAIHHTLPRPTDTHKGTYGHVLAVAGSRAMSGAGLLCSRAALKAGCGLVTWAVPDRILDSLIGHVPEVMLAGVPDEGRGDWEATDPQDILKLTVGKDVVAIGPGIGRFESGKQWLQQLWETIDSPLVLDADALYLLAEAIGNVPVRKAPTVITPHPGEMARLTNKTTAEVQADRIEIARQYAMQHQTVVVLKGARTVMAAPDGTVCINPAGNPGMATGGTGDVLTGMIAGLLAQGYDAVQAACLGMFLHGKAGDLAAERTGERALLASDLLERIE